MGIFLKCLCLALPLGCSCLKALKHLQTLDLAHSCVPVRATTLVPAIFKLSTLILISSPTNLKYHSLTAHLGPPAHIRILVQGASFISSGPG